MRRNVSLACVYRESGARLVGMLASIELFVSKEHPWLTLARLI